MVKQFILIIILALSFVASAENDPRFLSELEGTLVAVYKNENLVILQVLQKGYGPVFTSFYWGRPNGRVFERILFTSFSHSYVPQTEDPFTTNEYFFGNSLDPSAKDGSAWFLLDGGIISWGKQILSYSKTLSQPHLFTAHFTKNIHLFKYERHNLGFYRFHPYKLAKQFWILAIELGDFSNQFFEDRLIYKLFQIEKNRVLETPLVYDANYDQVKDPIHNLEIKIPFNDKLPIPYFDSQNKVYRGEMWLAKTPLTVLSSHGVALLKPVKESQLPAIYSSLNRYLPPPFMNELPAEVRQSCSNIFNSF
jgi:hypothetical protein